MAKTRRSKRAGRFRDAREGYTGDGRNMRVLTRAHYGPGLLAGTPDGPVMVHSDLSRLDRVCPRAVAKYELVPPPPRAIVWPPR